MLNRAKYKTRLTQNKKTKHISNAYSKTRRGERERKKKVTKSLGAFKGRIETIQVRKEHEGLQKISKRSKGR